MAIQTTHRPPANTKTINSKAQTAWQAWSIATKSCSARLQQLQTFNFVFRTLWDPHTREEWVRLLHAVQEDVLRAQQAWAAWQARAVAGGQAQRGQFRREHWQHVAAQYEETRTAWAYILQELAYAARADQHLLPADAQRLAARCNRYYQQIVYAAERARIAAAAPPEPPPTTG